jgi:hypothetical protein
VRGGWSILAAVFSLFSIGAGSAQFVCRTDSGYEIRRWELLLREDQFQEEELRRAFAPYATAPLEGEWYVAASSDPGFFEAREHLPTETGVSTTQAPVAYFFRFGDNAFFQFGRAGGEVRWVVMQGEDVFNRRIGKTKLRFIGQEFPRLAGEEDCGRQRRRLLFVSDAVDEVDLPEIARYYAGLARVSGRFDFSIWDSFEGAATYNGVRFPMIESMIWFERALMADFPADPGPILKCYSFSQVSEGEGEYIHYDGTGPARWTRRIALIGPNEP